MTTATLAFVGTALACSSIGAEIITVDNFDDNSIDGTKWTTSTAVPLGGASVRERNGRLELRNRGRLISTAEHDPLSDGPLRITGRWTFVTPTDFPGGDFLEILTRSDGLPNGRKHGDDNNGIKFKIDSISGSGRIQEFVDGSGEILAVLPPGVLPVDDGDTFLFDIVDDGLNLSFSIEEVGGEGASASLSAVSPRRYATNLVVFHNREANNGFETFSYLDDVSIAPVHVPEPASAPLMKLTLACVAIWYLLAPVRRGRRRAASSQSR